MNRAHREAEPAGSPPQETVEWEVRVDPEGAVLLALHGARARGVAVRLSPIQARRLAEQLRQGAAALEP